MPGRPWRSLLFAALVALVLGGSGMGIWIWARLRPVVQPLQRGLAGDGAAVDGADVLLREQLARLGAENAVLRNRIAEYQQIKGEGGIAPQRVVVARARVVGRTARQGRRWCELDVGAVDGVLRGMAVSSGWTLLGIVGGLQDGRSLVQQVGDSESRIAAVIIDPARQVLAEGVIAGTGQRDRFDLLHVAGREGLDIRPGLAVVSAGSDGRLPFGLVLGEVETARPPGAAAGRGPGDRWQITVRALRSADDVESVLVLRFDAAR
jgi:hypothetical protein